MIREDHKSMIRHSVHTKMQQRDGGREKNLCKLEPKWRRRRRRVVGLGQGPSTNNDDDDDDDDEL
jgi:hypothetical protein